MPKVNGQGQATVFTDQQLKKFMATVQADDQIKGGNYFTLFNLLYYTGERSGCIIQLQWNDIHFNEKVIKFRSDTRKGGSSREAIDIHPILLQVLGNEYKKHVGLETDYLFYALHPFQHINRNTLDKKFRFLLEKSGLDGKGFSLHSFRRTFVTRIYAVNKDVKECMAITGHKSVSAFMRYVEVDPQNIKKTIEAL